MRVVIIGGSHAGISCAMRTKKEYPDSQVIIFERQKSVGFIAQSIPFYLAGDSSFLKMSSYTTVSDLEKQGILVKTQVSVTDINLDSKSFTYIDLLDKSENNDTYDKLVIATGSYPSLPLAQGDYQDNLFIIKNFSDATKLKKFMRESRNVIVIGGGAIGTEITKLMSSLHIKTTLIHSSDHILNRYLDKEIAEEVQQYLEAEGAVIHNNTIVTSIREEQISTGGVTKKISHVGTRNGQEFIADGVIYATGFRPNSFLVADKVKLGDKGAIIVDDYMQTSYPDVFAVGDCATTSLRNVKNPTYVPHASDAILQGEAAAANLTEPRVRLNKSQGTYNLNFDKENTVCMTGLSLSKAQQEGFDCDMVFIRNDYVNSNYYFEMWIVYEKETYKILGMQSKGTAPEISSQADIVSLAIQNDMTVHELEYTDFYFKHGFKNPRSFTKMIADEIRQQEKLNKLY